MKHSSKRVTHVRATPTQPCIKGEWEQGPRSDLVALGRLYNSAPMSRIRREELLEEARLALMKYDLVEVELENAAQELAHTMHMLVEQQGGIPLGPEDQKKLERRVLDWCGAIGRPGDPTIN